MKPRLKEIPSSIRKRILNEYRGQSPLWFSLKYDVDERHVHKLLRENGFSTVTAPLLCKYQHNPQHYPLGVIKNERNIQQD